MPGPAGDHPDPPLRVRHGQQQGEAGEEQPRSAGRRRVAMHSRHPCDYEV